MFSFPVPRRLKLFRAILLAGATSALALAVRVPLWPLLDRGAPYSTFYYAVFFSAWAGGFWGGIAATAFSVLAADYYLIQPLYSFNFASEAQLTGTALFAVSGVLTSVLSEALHKARESSYLSATRAKVSAQDAQSARERERSILESIADGFVAFDPQWRITFVNEPGAHMLGYQRSELLGKHIVSLYPNVILSESYPKLCKAIEQGEAVHFEFYDEGSDRWYGNSAYPSRTGVSLFTRDVTESRKLADVVRDSEERFRIMADSAPLLIWTSTRTGRRDYVNRLFQQFSGRAYIEELGEGWIELVYPDDRERVRRAYERATEGQLSFAIEYRMRRHDGEYRWMLDSGAPRVSQRGEYLGSIGTCLDITDRRRAEESLRESEAHLRLSMSVSQMGTWQMDLERGILKLSPELEAIFGFPEGTSPNTLRAAFALVHPDDRDHLEKVMARFRERREYDRGGEYEVEYRFFRVDGTMRWLLVRGQGFIDQTGQTVAVSGVGIDVTERKELEERFRHAQKLESLGVLAGGIAHDFNNLLTGIMGNASMVLDYLEPNSPAWSMQESVLEGSERAAQLTSQMLAYSGKGRFFIEQIDMGALVKDNMRLMQASIHNKKVELKLDLTDEPCIVEADPSQMQQIVMNLVINAAEAVPADEGGEVRVATFVRRLNEDTSELKTGDYVVLEVQDTGIGMDEATQRRIFDPFFTTKFTGRGLGLAAVQGIVRGHKGSIAVTSTPGAGTTFHVHFPRSSSAPTPKPTEPASHWQGSGTILIVDDEEIVRRAAKTALERFGFRVVAAEHGMQAVELFQAAPEKFAAVLLDMTMPVLNGEEALPILKRIRPDVKVIVCSGYSETEAQQRFSNDGLDAFIQKPYSSSQLAEKVRAVTAGS